MAYVGLLDCNNFFVSCERLFRPDLLGKPVVVLSSNDGCVVARSKEVKELGIPMGIPYFKVKRELEEAGVVMFSSNFPLYRDISYRVMEVLQDEAANVEQYSVDEAFFTVPAVSHEEAYGMISRIKCAVEMQVGVPVTVSAAKTKTIAKCGSELGKKSSGITVLAGESWRSAALEFPLADVWGIGGRTAAKMREAGLNTVAEFLRADPARVRSMFGVSGIRLQTELNEQTSRRTHREDELQQSIMSTRSFKASTTELSVLEDAVAYHVAHAAEELREMDACAQELRVILRTSRHGDWVLRGGTRSALLVTPTSDTRILLHEALLLTRSLYEPGVPYKKAGVVLSHIVPSAAVPQSLFSNGNEQDGNLFETIDRLNRRYGSGTLSIGRTGSEQRWQPSRSHVSPRYTTNWSEIPTAMS